MTLHYLDASAWVKRYCREAGSVFIRHLFHQNSLLGCATLGVIEVSATLSRKRRAGEMDPTLLEDARRRLQLDWSRFYRVELSAAVMETALRVTAAWALRGADAVHLASALVLRDRLALGADQFTVVSSDWELKEAARKTDLTVVDPEED
jgi:hypothetical protein